MVSTSRVFISALFASYVVTHHKQNSVSGASNRRSNTNSNNSRNHRNNNNASTSSSMSYFFIQPTSDKATSSSLKASKVVRSKQIRQSKKVKRMKLRPDASYQNDDEHDRYQHYNSQSLVSNGRGGSKRQHHFSAASLQDFSYPHEASGLRHYVIPLKPSYHHRPHRYAPEYHSATDENYLPYKNHHYGSPHDSYHAHEAYRYGNHDQRYYGHQQQPNVIVKKPPRRRKGFTHHFDFFGTEDPWALFGIVACIMLALPLVKAVITLPMANVLNNLSRLAYLSYLNRNGTRVFGLRSLDKINQDETLSDNIQDNTGAAQLDLMQFVETLKEAAREAIFNQW